MAMVVAEDRLTGPAINLLIDELLQLKIMRDKVDHPRKGSKDLADAVCGSVFNAISRSKPQNNEEIDIHTYDSLRFDREDEKDTIVMNMIRAPRIPKDLSDVLDGMEII